MSSWCDELLLAAFSGRIGNLQAPFQLLTKAETDLYSHEWF